VGCTRLQRAPLSAVRPQAKLLPASENNGPFPENGSAGCHSEAGPQVRAKLGAGGEHHPGSTQPAEGRRGQAEVRRDGRSVGWKRRRCSERAGSRLR